MIRLPGRLLARLGGLLLSILIIALLKAVPLLSASFYETALGVLLLVVGSALTIRGVPLRRERPPGFAERYRGGPCPPLAILYLGLFLLSLGAFAIAPLLGWTVLRLLLLPIGVACGAIYLYGAFVRFPRALLPAWYRRALLAGVRSDSPPELRAFRSLSLSAQRERVAAHQRWLSGWRPGGPDNRAVDAEDRDGAERPAPPDMGEHRPLAVELCTTGMVAGLLLAAHSSLDEADRPVVREAPETEGR